MNLMTQKKSSNLIRTWSIPIKADRWCRTRSGPVEQDLFDRLEFFHQGVAWPSGSPDAGQFGRVIPEVAAPGFPDLLEQLKRGLNHRRKYPNHDDPAVWACGARTGMQWMRFNDFAGPVQCLLPALALQLASSDKKQGANAALAILVRAIATKLPQLGFGLKRLMTRSATEIVSR